jgi:hypothetical protein
MVCGSVKFIRQVPKFGKSLLSPSSEFKKVALFYREDGSSNPLRNIGYKKGKKWKQYE